MPPPDEQTLRDAFDASGFLGPVRVWDEATCRAARELIWRTPPPADWTKGYAASSRLFYDLGTAPALLDRVEALLGEDVMFWGAAIVQRAPGRIHPWHTDLETSSDDGRTVSVWVGLENTTRDSSLQLISGSHRFGTTIQECAHDAGVARDATDADAALRWAQQRDAESALVVPDMGDGEAVFFDGRLWHGSDNTGSATRTALLLQYATPDTPIRMPDPTAYAWPFRFHDTPPFPPCVMVRGSDRSGINRIVSAPQERRGRSPILSSRAEPVTLPLADNPDTGWQPHPLFRGATPATEDLKCHISVLSPGVSPHPPHQHEEEEILLVLDGEADLILVDDAGAERRERVRPGDFAYYPSWQLHTLECPEAGPVTYLMLKWQGTPGERDATLQTEVFRLDVERDADTPWREEGWQMGRLFEGPTKHLRKLHAHLSTLEPGAGYPAHSDAYDVVIVTLRGTVESLGAQVGPNSVFFYAAGEPHGMENVGDEPASYLVFEFHGGHERPALPKALHALARALPRPVRDLARKGLGLVRR